MPKISNLDWSMLAAQELAARGHEPVDHEPDYERWKLDQVEFIDECRLVGGRLHVPQKRILREAIQWEDVEVQPDELIEKPIVERRPFVIDCIVEKTRQVGMSWLWMAAELWLILFWGPVRILNAHQKFEDVDDGGQKSTIASLHGRLREMYDSRIPAWLRHKVKLSFKEGVIQNESGGFIRGSTATPNIGRGLTLDMALLDEFAHMDWSRLIWASVSQACKRGKIANSTPNGRGNAYFQLVHEHKRRRMVKITYHWTEHPVFNVGMHVSGDDPNCPDCVSGSHFATPGTMTSPWYEQQCDIIGDSELIAQELDISYDRSTRARVYPEADRHRHLQEVSYNPGARHVVAWDFGYAGATVLIFMQIELFTDRIDIETLAYHEDSGQIIDDYVPVVKAWEDLYNVRLQHVGDPAGLAKNLTSGEGPIHALARHGIYCDAPDWLHHDAKEGIRLVRVALRGATGGMSTVPVYVKINPLAERLMVCLEQTHYPVDRQGERKPGAEMPEDNEFTHGSDAFRYGVHYVFKTMLSRGSAALDIETRGVLFGGVMTEEF